MQTQQIIGAAYDAALQPELWSNVLAATSKLLGADMVSVRVFDRDDSEVLMVAEAACLTPELYAQYRQEWVARDVHTRHARAKPWLWNRPVVSEFELVPQEEERRDPYVQEFLSTADLCRGLTSISSAPQGMTTLALLKSARAPLASNEILAVSAVIFPHLLRAARMAARTVLTPDVAHVFETAPHAVFLLDHQTRLVWLNAHAEALLRKSVFRRRMDGVLRGAGAAAVFLDGLAHDARAQSGGSAPRVTMYRHGDDALVLRGRVIGQRTWPAIVFQRAAILIECTSALISGSVAERLRRTFGLTQAESAVALLLSEDQGTAEIARTRQVSAETVRSQSRAIMRKVGVSRRAALTHIVAKLSD